MSYDLAFWEGLRPRDDKEALDVFEKLWDELETAESSSVRPTQSIRDLVDALESRWPGHDLSAPWATYPLTGDASGPTLYVNLVHGRPDTDLMFMAATARRLGVVCFDPQLEAML